MMDVLSRYGMLLWFAVAMICVVLGSILTFANQPRRKPSATGRLKRPTPVLPVLSSSSIAPRRCFACGQPADDPEASFCGFCGAALTSAPAPLRRTAGTSTVLVDERALEQVMPRGNHARWR